MKKTPIFYFLAAVIMLAGCGKNEEESNSNSDSGYTLPAEYHDMTAARHLKKIFKEDVNYDWTGHNDTVIIPDSTVFVWDNDRVCSVHEYHYTVSEFDNQVFLYDEITYSCTYENDRIANIHCDETIYWNDSVGNRQSDMWEWDVPFNYTGSFLTLMGGTKLYYNDSSDVIDMKFIWEGEWVSQYKNPVWQNRNLTEITYIDLSNNTSWQHNYSYDNKISAYRCIPRELAIFFGLSNLSRNNVVEMDNYNYFSYEYDGDYPVTRTLTHANGIETTHYEYE